jgi:hypothetical protein
MREKLDARTIAGDLLDPAARQLYEDHVAAQRRHCRWPTISAADTEAMVKAFIASHGGVTQCTPAYAAPTMEYACRPQRGRRGLLE